MYFLCGYILVKKYILSVVTFLAFFYDKLLSNGTELKGVSIKPACIQFPIHGNLVRSDQIYGDSYLFIFTNPECPLVKDTPP